MSIVDFLKTVYLGDRGCKSILIDGWNSVVKVQVTCISRVRSATWDYYTEEDLPDGFIVLEGVTSIAFAPTGVIPNDCINEVRAEPADDGKQEYYVFISVDAVDPQGNRTEVEIRVRAGSMSLEDSRKPGERIVQ